MPVVSRCFTESFFLRAEGTPRATSNAFGVLIWQLAAAEVEVLGLWDRDLWPFRIPGHFWCQKCPDSEFQKKEIRTWPGAFCNFLIARVVFKKLHTIQTALFFSPNKNHRCTRRSGDLLGRFLTRAGGTHPRHRASPVGGARWRVGGRRVGVSSYIVQRMGVFLYIVFMWYLQELCWSICRS